MANKKQKMKLKQIEPVSCAKIFGVTYAILGLIIGAFFTMFALLGAAFSMGRMGIFGVLFGVGAIIILPLFYGLVGFLSGLLIALMYNLIASKFGGIELEFE